MKDNKSLIFNEYKKCSVRKFYFSVKDRLLNHL